MNGKSEERFEIDHGQPNFNTSGFGSGECHSEEAARRSKKLAPALKFECFALEKVVQGEILKKGDEGEAVLRLQQALIDLGFALPAGADSKYGGQTIAAVQAFQLPGTLRTLVNPLAASRLEAMRVADVTKTSAAAGLVTVAFTVSSQSLSQ